MADDDEVDPLDAFMAEINTVVTKQKADVAARPKDAPAKSDKPSRFGDDEDDDEIAAFLKHKAQRAVDAAKAPNAAFSVSVKYDEHNNPIVEKKEIEPLPLVDHSSVKYESFKRSFYREAAAIAALSGSEVARIRDEASIRVQGSSVPKPIREFSEAGFGPRLMRSIEKIGFERPTAIQAQALPVVLSGRDVIGVAKTGSGKTMAFVWPMLVHIKDQRPLRKGDGPIGVILAPTRELAHQIYVETKKFAKPQGLRMCAVYGGVTKWEQVKTLSTGCEIVVATPGRFIDIVKSKATNLQRCTYLVLDEADRMFEMGFEPQVRSIVKNVRPDRQTLLFSATFKRRIENLARDALTNPVRITVGVFGQTNESVNQKVWVFSDNSKKYRWLASRVEAFLEAGKLLIFVNKKEGAETLANHLNEDLHNRAGRPSATPGFATTAPKVFLSIHGNKSQHERTDVIRKFKKGIAKGLVATDVAARGLDIKDIRTVVNFDAAMRIETHVHRCGRTGRMGVDGTDIGNAHTLVTHKEFNFAADLVNNLRVSGQDVPPELIEVAKRSKHFQQHGGRGGRGKGKGGWSGPVNAGLGFGAGGPSSRRASASAAPGRLGGGNGARFARAPASGAAGGMRFVAGSTNEMMATGAPRAYQAPAAGGAAGNSAGGGGGEGLSSRLSALREMRQRVRNNTASSMSKHFVAAASSVPAGGAVPPSAPVPAPPPPPVQAPAYAAPPPGGNAADAGSGSGAAALDPIQAAIAAARARAAAAGIQSAPASGVKRGRWEEAGTGAGSGNYKVARQGWGSRPSQPYGYVKGQRY